MSIIHTVTSRVLKRYFQEKEGEIDQTEAKKVIRLIYRMILEEKRTNETNSEVVLDQDTDIHTRRRETSAKMRRDRINRRNSTLSTTDPSTEPNREITENTRESNDIEIQNQRKEKHFNSSEGLSHSEHTSTYRSLNENSITHLNSTTNRENIQPEYIFEIEQGDRVNITGEGPEYQWNI
ncbi:hypothetical protein NEOKW01_1033 [Nematocida sp. AWRm80]|nr:hypothetical protein NEOKW01_1033 [Nematocida sp. AWRm80]